MLIALATLAVLVVALSWGRQAVWSLRLALNFPPRATPPDPPDDAWPHVTGCLPVRGADPLLAECLRGLCKLDYPSYEIRIVVDSAEDPAWPAIRKVLAEFPAVKATTSVLTERLETCSLK